MNKLKQLLAAYFAPYEKSGMIHGNPACSTDELAEAIVNAVELRDRDEAELEAIAGSPGARKRARKPAAEQS